MVAGKPLTLITAHGGETFYVGNRRGADGSNLQPDFVRSGPRTEHEDFRREASRRLGREVDLATSSAFWQRQAWAEIAADPGGWTRLLGKKAWLLANDYEKGDNEDPATLRALIPAAALPLPGFGLALALALLGALAIPRRDHPTKSFLGLAAMAYAAGCLLFFVTGRYRLPLAVPLLIVAGEGLSAGLAGLRHPDRRLAPAAVAFAGALIICHWPLATADRNDPALAAVNLGVLYEAQGDFPQAVSAYRRAIVLSPELALAHFNLGVAERRQGHLAAADSAFRDALRLDPENADALDQLGMTHEQGGDLESARLLYERALAIDPNHARTYRDLGRLHVLRGDLPAAIVAWEKALALAPGDSTTAARLAALKARQVPASARGDERAPLR
jgi:tetratricopeptide (TPR) repeat protein